MRIGDERKFSCFICRTWWIWLLLIFILLAAILTSTYWLPVLGF